VSGLKTVGLDAAIANLQELERNGFERGVRGAAAEVETTARAQWAAGRGPDNEPWPPRKKDGAIALQGLAERATFAVHVPDLVITFDEHAIHHQHGAPRANIPQRRLVPWGESVPPSPWEEASDRGFKRSTGLKDK
jgi:hypothetical protein